MKTAGHRIYRTRALFSGSGSRRARPGPGWRRAARAFEVVLVASALVGAMVLAGGGAAQAASTITYLSQFGSQGTGPGQFESPAAIAVNTATGDVYVTDVVNNVVEVFSASGSYLSEFGGGTAFPAPNGQLYQPIAIAVDPGSGDVYVLDYNGALGSEGARIQKFDASGNFLLSWMVGSYFTNQVAVDPATGDVYVTDQTSNQVVEFDPSGDQIAAFGSSGNGNGQFSTPTTIAVDPGDGDLYVNDTTPSCRVQKLDSSGNFLFQFGGCGSGDGQFGDGGVGNYGDEIAGPTGLAVDPVSGDVYAVDGGNNRVEVFDSAGNYLSQFGGPGSGNGQFSNPDGDALNPATGQLYVVDNGNQRVQVFGTSPASTTTVSSSANPSVPGQSVTYTATVSPVPEEGTVAFADNGQPITACSSQPVDTSTGNATCTVSYPGTGSHQITAAYSNSTGAARLGLCGADAERPARRDHRLAHLLAQPLLAGPGRHLHRHRDPGRPGGRHPDRHGELLRRQHPDRGLHRPGPHRQHRHLHRDLHLDRLALGHRHLRRGHQLRRLGPVRRS